MEDVRERRSLNGFREKVLILLLTRRSASEELHIAPGFSILA
jgi:hypothetical protein